MSLELITEIADTTRAGFLEDEYVKRETGMILLGSAINNKVRPTTRCK